MKKELYELAIDLYNKPLLDLIYDAHKIHIQFYNTQDIQKCALLSIKTGACPENCAYCPQSVHYNTGLKPEPLMDINDVITAAKIAKKNGAKRFCMGTATRQLRNGQYFEKLLNIIKAVNDEGLEVCVTLGLLNQQQAHLLKAAGVYAYNHNLDTSRNYYLKIITTRTYDERLNTIACVRSAGMTVCCGGIIGMGETIQDRCQLIAELASFNPQPESVPINLLIPIKGTPLENTPAVDSFDLIRTIATTRILIPAARIRLSAGRTQLNKEAHTLAFFAGANSIFIGDKLLTAENQSLDFDKSLFSALGIAES